MIIKSFELNKINFFKGNIILLYGKNNGLKQEIINKLIKNKTEISFYDEGEILEIQNNFLENIQNKSLFEQEKTIIVKRASDKIYKIIEKISSLNVEDKIIILSDNLEKKSKLRSLFEKDKDLLCIPLYPDNFQTLSKLASNYLNQKNIKISQSNINQLINSVSGDRENLFNELQKLENYSKNGKKLTNENLAKLINLSENYSISELIDNCLAKNKNKTIKILNENNFSNEDCILISRAFLIKSKRILNLSLEYEKNKDMNLTITRAKPPIFWKDKDITIQQIKKWSPKNLRLLIYKINEIELAVKRSINNSLNIITDFILEQSSLEANN